MSIIEEKVYSKKFGPGRVIKGDISRFTVLFSDANERSFTDVAFGLETIVFIDTEVQKKVFSELANQEKLKEQVKQQQEEELKEKASIALPNFTTINARNTARFTNKLISSKEYSLGTNSKDIYIDCCKKLNWDVSQSNKFGWQTPLYAECATPEKYYVWFVGHNNWTNTKSEFHLNYISSDLEVIYEIDDKIYAIESMPRVTIAKTSDGQYVFIGIYQEGRPEYRMQDGRQIRVRIFKRISTTYPEE